MPDYSLTKKLNIYSVSVRTDNTRKKLPALRWNGRHTPVNDISLQSHGMQRYMYTILKMSIESEQA